MSQSIEWTPRIPKLSALDEQKKRNPYDISTWGSECGRGIPYADLGTRIEGRQSVLKISGGRKCKGKRG